MPSGSSRGVLLAAVLLIALNLRPAISSIAPLLETIRADLMLSHAAASLLTGIPLLCMGLFPFFAAPLTSQLGLARGLLWAVMLIAGATLLRVSAADTAVLFATALLAGIGIAVAQAIVPGIVKKHFSDRSASVMSLYSMCMTLGAGLAAAVTAPLREMLGAWPPALALWTVPAALAALAWLPFTKTPVPEGTSHNAPQAFPWRNPWAWLITAYSAGAFGLFWSAQTWLAPLYEEQGWSPAAAGLMVAGMVATQVVIQFLLAAIADRWRDRRPLMIAGLVTAAAGLAAVALVPLASPWLWSIVLGLGIGCIFPLALNLPIDQSADRPHRRSGRREPADGNGAWRRLSPCLADAGRRRMAARLGRRLFDAVSCTGGAERRDDHRCPAIATGSGGPMVRALSD
jgi:CP family cyanate transporter-like MFS transporter